MLVSAVLDPEALDVSNFETNKEYYLLQLELFVRGIIENGVLLVDTGGQLKGRIKNKLKLLSEKFPEVQDLKTLFEEIFRENEESPRRRMLLYADVNIEEYLASNHAQELRAPFRKFKNEYIAEPDRLNIYYHSKFERKRRHYLFSLPPIDILDEEDKFKDLMRRITRYSSWLIFYDKMIGASIEDLLNKGESNLQSFVAGIKSILDIWLEKEPLFQRGKVTIFTAIRRKDVSYSQIEAVVSSQLINPLKALHKEIDLLIKKDPNGIFHARHLQTEHQIILFERGFDLMRKDGSFRRQIIKIDDVRYIKKQHTITHLDEIHELDNIDGLPV